MRTGTTKSGFAFAFDEANADDMRLVDALAIVMDGESSSFEVISAASRATELLLGREQKRALYAHVGKSYGGRVPSEPLMHELEEIMSSGEDAEKNS